MRLKVGRLVIRWLSLTTMFLALMYAGRRKMSIFLQNEVQPENEMQTKRSLPSQLANVDSQQYEAKLKKCSSPRNVILLALVDTSFLDMTFNFYETSILKFNITNYLFIASDYDACRALETRNINCFVYMKDENAKSTTVYGSSGFIQKMNIRTFFILDALKAGFTVLHSDVDIIFIQNPLPQLQDSEDGDIHCLWDMSTCNAGFLYIKPSKFSIDVYTAMKKTALKTKLDDQTALNKALKSVTTKNKQLARKLRKLSMEQYQCGLKYFEKGNRYFANSAPCRQCVVVHNNWIVSKEAKRYRFREVLLWSDDDNGYYSNKTTKFLTYSNPLLPTKNILKRNISDMELDVLKTALYLGHILKRVVILPRFHITQKKGANAERPLNQWIKMLSFDGKFYGKYRENSFLLHPKVPREVKDDRTKPFWIRTDRSMSLLGAQPSNVTVLTPRNETIATTSEILDWFGDKTSAILVFHSLYGVFGDDIMPRDKGNKGFNQILNNAFKRSNYRQL